MILHVVFAKGGIPGWIGAAPREGSEPVDMSELDGDPVMFLAGHRRQPGGNWVPRDPPPPPSAEDLAAQEAAQRAAEHAAALAAREAAIDAAIDASEAARLFRRGRMTLTAYRAEAERIAAEVEAGFPVPGL